MQLTISKKRKVAAALFAGFLISAGMGIGLVDSAHADGNWRPGWCRPGEGATVVVGIPMDFIDSWPTSDGVVARCVKPEAIDQKDDPRVGPWLAAGFNAKLDSSGLSDILDYSAAEAGEWYMFSKWDAKRQAWDGGAGWGAPCVRDSICVAAAQSRGGTNPAFFPPNPNDPNADYGDGGNSGNVPVPNPDPVAPGGGGNPGGNPGGGHATNPQVNPGYDGPAAPDQTFNPGSDQGGSGSTTGNGTARRPGSRASATPRPSSSVSASPTPTPSPSRNATPSASASEQVFRDEPQAAELQDNKSEDKQPVPPAALVVAGAAGTAAVGGGAFFLVKRLAAAKE